MKKIKQIIFLSAILLFTGACDQDFVEINTDPFAINDINPQLLFAGAQRTYTGGWEQEHTIVQQFVNPVNEGATLAFNFNADIDGFQNDPWGAYTGSLKEFVHILHLIETEEEYTGMINLQSMTRIWKAQTLMVMTDTYTDIPYFNIGLAAIGGAEYFYPPYNDDEAIYEDLYEELSDAINKLDPNADFVSADLFYGANAYYPSSDVATQVEKWKKLGNSILLRLGMRYSKLNPDRAKTIVSEAFNSGVMTSNEDNAFVVYDGTDFVNLSNFNLVNNQPRFYYAAEPFVDHLKATNDPRSKYIIATYEEPGNPLATEVPDVTLENQFGVPVGILGADLTEPPYRGAKGQGFNYSQMNVNVVASQKAPTFWVTYAQTSLLLAEAAYRGWISGDAKQFYEDGIKADMDIMALYISETGSNYEPISQEEQNAFLAQEGVAYNSSNALELINTQYWVACIRNGAEAWANFRRTYLPTLERNTANDNLLQNGGDGYVHRFTYPDAELSENKENYQSAVQAIGGEDDNVTRAFWDIKQ